MPNDHVDPLAVPILVALVSRLTFNAPFDRTQATTRQLLAELRVLLASRPNLMEPAVRVSAGMLEGLAARDDPVAINPRDVARRAVQLLEAFLIPGPVVPPPKPGPPPRPPKPPHEREKKDREEE